MSGENLATNLEIEHKENNLNSGISNRVNINNLMTKVREQEKKERKENIIFLSLIGSVVLVTGIIASLG
tara:strand:- start:6668 stop:6874 length:207 start_codon:yes stop_codon:yes gene_type:complete